VHDIEIGGYQVRFRRTLAEQRPTLASIDTEALARERAYGASNAEAALAAFRAAREKTMILIHSFTREQYERTAVFRRPFSRCTPMRCAGILSRLAGSKPGFGPSTSASRVFWAHVNGARQADDGFPIDADE
jgi:hypothetical protein